MNPNLVGVLKELEYIPLEQLAQLRVEEVVYTDSRTNMGNRLSEEEDCRSVMEGLCLGLAFLLGQLPLAQNSHQAQ